MGRSGRNFLLWTLIGVALACAVAAGVWRLGYGQALDQVARRGEADLALAADRLTAQLQRYQELAVLTAEHPVLTALTYGAPRAEADRLLLEIADKTSAMMLAYAAPDGTVLAASHPGPASFAGRADFDRALTGALGAYVGVDATEGRRAYFYAAPGFDAAGRVQGVLLVAADVDIVEAEWRGARPTVYFVNGAREVFISNRSELLFWQRTEAGLSAPGARPATLRQTDGRTIWEQSWSPYLPQRALHLTQELPVIGLTAEALIDVAPARRIAHLQAAAVGGLMLFFGALLGLAMIRRRTLAEVNAALETRVAARTEALSAANTALMREIAEREEAEAALTRAQADLVQASKLSALGQMSAGISHELNQPLMAIRSFAENGAAFVARGKPEKAAENLTRISDLARRMGRIIKNLRAFARQETEPFGTTDVRDALETALEMTEERRLREGVALTAVPPPGPVWAEAGDVRLVQVLVNLITNACDAMQGQEDKALAISLTAAGARVRIEIADNGPGLADPGRIFDPFYSTKEVGASEGMGLGLSISYGIVQSFGGEIRGSNGADGGAVFTIELGAATARSAA
ncbi:ATP-binding protein [Pseudaestuariivita sp.]|uniref:ATP-binding protein n=1 Tax=Pseudaestuariivita sp. TaxID=2211669 RepID=UPI00405A19CA